MFVQIKPRVNFIHPYGKLKYAEEFCKILNYTCLFWWAYYAPHNLVQSGQVTVWCPKSLLRFTQFTQTCPAIIIPDYLGSEKKKQKQGFHSKAKKQTLKLNCANQTPDDSPTWMYDWTKHLRTTTFGLNRMTQWKTLVMYLRFERKKSTTESWYELNVIGFR